MKAMYTTKGALVTSAEGFPKQSLNVGDTVYTVTNPRQVLIVKNPAEFVSRNLSAYDELKNRLMKVKERYPDAEDAEDIIVAAENEVIYDKIIQLMDVAREAGFPNISIAKLRS
jgi:biopolymer transport protein ExbD